LGSNPALPPSPSKSVVPKASGTRFDARPRLALMAQPGAMREKGAPLLIIDAMKI